MPYIIIVNRPGFLPEQEPYAVATLEEARGAAQDELSRSPLWDDPNSDEEARYKELSAEVQSLSESGGVIGPLPDGYVVEVRHVDRAELLALLGLEGHGDPDISRLIELYNAA